MSQTTTDINCPNISNQVFNTIVNFLGIFINTVLFIVIKQNTTKALQNYAIILRIACIIDTFSSITQYLTQARPNFVGDKFMLTFSVDGILPRMLSDLKVFADGNLALLLIPEYVGCFYSVSFSSVPFIYRYFLICWNRTIKHYELSILLFLLFVLSLVPSVAVNYAAAQIYSINIQYLPTFNKECVRFLPQFSETHNKEQVELFRIYRIFFYSCQIILSTYLIIFFCAYRIHKFLKLQVNTSIFERKIQKQVSRTLAIQALNPLVAFFGPTIFVIITSQLHIKTSFAMDHFFDLYAIIPVLNSTAVFLLIPTYRTGLLNLILKVIARILKLFGFVESHHLPAWLESHHVNSSGLNHAAVSPMS